MSLALLFALCLFLTGCFYRKWRPFFKDKEVWFVLGLVLLSFWIKVLFLWGHLGQRLEGIGTGGDYYHYILLPLQFVLKGEFISLNCGNLALFLPLAGFFYKLFHFFPGLNYLCYFLIFLSSLAIMVPWLLVRRSPYSWIGLIGVAFLAANPLLSELKIPYVSTTYIGFFTTAFSLYFCVRALQENTRSLYFLSGISLALLMMSRTVFIPWAFAMVLGLVVLSAQRKRALLACISFALLAVVYEWAAVKSLAARGIQISSYFLFFIIDGVGNSVVHRADQMPQDWLKLLLWLPHHLLSYLKVLYENLLPLKETPAILKGMAALVMTGSFVLLIIKKTRVGLFLAGAFMVYLFEISSYWVNERLLIPMCALLGIVLSLAFYELKARKSAFFVLTFLILTSLGLTGMNSYRWVLRKNETQRFMVWAAGQMPEKSVVFSSKKQDPVELYRYIHRPIFYNAPNKPTLVVNRRVIPVRRVIFLSQQIAKPTVRDIQVALNAFANKGYEYYIVDENYAQILKQKGYMLKQVAQYPENNQKGIWMLDWQSNFDEENMVNEHILTYWETEKQETG